MNEEVLLIAATASLAQPQWATHEEMVPVAPHRHSHYHSCILWRQLRYLCVSLWLYVVIVSVPLVWKCPSLWCRNSPWQKCRPFISCPEAGDTMERSHSVHRVSPAGVVASTSTVSQSSSLVPLCHQWVLAFEIFIPLVLFFILLGLRQKKPAIPVKEGRQTKCKAGKKKTNPMCIYRTGI